SAPLTWDEVDACDPRDFTLATMPRRFAELGDRHAAIDSHPCSLARLLELSARHERGGLGDAPWPPHYRKQVGEPSRAQPSRPRVTKHPLIELAWGDDFKLVVATVARRLIRPPPQKDGRVAKTPALQVIVLDLADPLNPQRLPRQVFACTPPALGARHPGDVAGATLRPVAP